MRSSSLPSKSSSPPAARVSLALGLLLALLFAACKGAETTQKGPDPKAVVARVNEQPILVEELVKEIHALKRKLRVEANRPLDEGKRLWLKMEAMNPLIQNILFEQEAKKNGIIVTPEEFQEALADATADYPEEAFQQALDNEGLTAQEWKNKLKFNVLIKKLINQLVDSKVTVGEEELKQYFDAHAEEFQMGEEVRALHIMVETEEEALKIRKLLGRKGKNFEELARQYSIAPEGPTGGDMGFMDAESIPAEFDVFFKLDINEISNVIETPYGSHIFKVIEKNKARQKTFDEAKKSIERRLTQDHRDQAFQEWLAELRENAEIHIEEDILAKIA